MGKLEVEPEGWAAYEREIREVVLHEEPSSRAREVVNEMLAKAYEKIEPLLSTQRTLTEAEGYREALKAHGLPQDDMAVRGELEAERARTDDIVKRSRARIEGLRGGFANDIRRVHMLRAIREKLPPPDDNTRAEPP